ncbi:putative structural constituent of nuclear pore [Trypoxylus dichotomus]
MSFPFGSPKTTATGFTLPTTSTGSTGFQFGGASGDAKTIKPPINLTSTPSVTTSAPLATTASGSFNFAASTTVTPFNLGNATTTPATTLSFSLGTTSAPISLTTSIPGATGSTTTFAPLAFALSTNTTSKTTTTAPAVTTTVATTSITTNVQTSTSTSITPSLSATTTLTFSQIEDSINKWTIYLEEEGKHYTDQAKQINAWDRLLITNGEKIMNLNKGIERVKQQQEQLDQELDFVLAQQKELDDLIDPLEKEIENIQVTDLDRHRTYQMAETLDTQLKQMSEDLKEIIEHLNESNKIQEMTNPIVQIGRILNVHMNSLQWIDRNTTKITTHLDQIAKMHDMNKRNHEINLQRTYE